MNIHNNSKIKDAAATSRHVIRAAIVKAEELRAIHAALLHQGTTTSPTTHRSSFLSSSPPEVAHHHLLRSDRHHQLSSSAQDYPVFTPTYEDEPSPGYQQKSRALSENWEEDYNGRDDDEITSQTNYTTLTQDAASRKGSYPPPGLASLKLDPLLNSPAADLDSRSVTSSCTNYRLSQLLNSSTNLTEPAIDRSRRRIRNSLGGDFNSVASSSCHNHKCQKQLDHHGNHCSRHHHSSNIIFPMTDTHVMSVNPQHRSKSRARKIFSWLLPRFNKKQKGEENNFNLQTAESQDVSRILRDQFGPSVSVELLKEELVETCRQRDAALAELAEMRYSFGDFKLKLENLENYCRQLTRAHKKPNGSSPKPITGVGNITDTTDNTMPVTNEVMLEGFLQMVSEARSSVKHFCKMLLSQVEQSVDEQLIQNLNYILRPHNLFINSKQNKSVLYHLQAIMNQALFQDFENCVFQKNGSPKVLDPNQARLERFSSFVALRNLSWDQVLEKGTKYYSEDLGKFCDQKMSSVITVLNWTNPWPQHLLQSFFVAAKCIWLLHLLAFSSHPTLRILRVEENRAFDHHYMEDLPLRRQRSHGANCQVKVMVMPGFYVHDKILKSKVLCKY